MAYIWDFPILKIGKFILTSGELITAIIVLFAARMLAFIFSNVYLKRYFRKHDFDPGRAYAINRIIRYFIYFVATLAILKIFGVNLSVIFLGSAGLLVGIGFGIQKTFVDLMSGIILLSEGSIAVGDVIVVDGMVGIVKKIGLRTSEVKTRDQVMIIIPNSKLTEDKVINWSHNDSPARFEIAIGVEYGTEVSAVERIILQAIKDDENVLSNPKPQIQLENYGKSSLDFKLYFFSDEFFFIEKVKSDLRKKILSAFIENNIRIPFPQTVVTFKNKIENYDSQ